LYLKHADLLADKLLGINSLQQRDVEVVKDVAKRNWLRQRQELDRAPRVSAATLAVQAQRLRTIDDVMNAYNKMRREDFCDVVASVVRGGNLSHDAENMALYFREWVLSKADLQMVSFPEWLETDGRQRILSLNEEWLRTCVDRHMSFNQWLVSAKQP
jgi:hypothetical protein